MSGGPETRFKRSNRGKSSTSGQLLNNPYSSTPDTELLSPAVFSSTATPVKHSVVTTAASSTTPTMATATTTTSSSVDTDARLAEVLHSLTKLSVGDSTFTPKTFAGTQKDIENVDIWLRYLQQYTDFRKLDNDSSLQMFKLLLVDQAAEWLHSLPSEITNSLARLTKAFTDRYTLNELQRWQKATSMWSRQQQPTESVDSYITEIRKLARLVNMTDQQMLRHAINNGLRPNIKLHVLQSNENTLEGVIGAARIAEAAQAAVPDSPSAAVGELTKTIAALVDGMLAQKKTSTSVTCVEKEPEEEAVNMMENVSSPGRPSRSSGQRQHGERRRSGPSFVDGQHDRRYQPQPGTRIVPSFYSRT